MRSKITLQQDKRNKL